MPCRADSEDTQTQQKSTRGRGQTATPVDTRRWQENDVCGKVGCRIFSYSGACNPFQGEIVQRGRLGVSCASQWRHGHFQFPHTTLHAHHLPLNNRQQMQRDLQEITTFLWFHVKSKQHVEQHARKICGNLTRVERCKLLFNVQPVWFAREVPSISVYSLFRFDVQRWRHRGDVVKAFQRMLLGGQWQQNDRRETVCGDGVAHDIVQ